MSAPTTGPLRQGTVLNFHSPVVISVIVAAVIGLVALGFIFVPPFGLGPAASGAASPSPSPTRSITGSAEPTSNAEPTSSASAPSPAAVPTATPVSTQTPPTAWTGLVWSDPVTPSFTVHLTDLVPWDGRYVAVGSVEVNATRSEAAFLTSPDGLDWTIRQRHDTGIDRSPRHLVALGDELFAFSSGDDVLIWSTTDGSSWSLVESSSWQQASADLHGGGLPAGWDPTQHPISMGLVAVASGPRGVVAIGNTLSSSADQLAPVLLHSTDGRSWTVAALPAGSDSALLNSVVEHNGRFVVTGAVGVGADPTTATAAAWYSDDGLTWVRAHVEADEFGLTADAEFGPLWAADNGLITCRGSRNMTAGGWRYMDGWLSTDGTSWRYSPQAGPHPACDWSASDGTRIVSLGPRGHASPTQWPGVTVASTSTDGVEWQSLELYSTLTDQPERFWVVPHGVIYAGIQSFWFGTAVTE